MKKLIIHTDGACEGNPGPGGWAAVLQYGQHRKEVSGAEPATTNNRMEMMAAIEALTVLTEPCEITLFTDSAYLKNGITEWVAGWKRRGWRTAEKKPVKNEDLWRQLDTLATQHTIEWKWLKGHAGHVENERCDALAVAAIATIKQQYKREELARLKEQFVAAQGSAADATLLLP